MAGDKHTECIYWCRDGTIKTLKVFLYGFVFVIHWQISGQETAIRSEKWCCGYLLYLQLARGRTAHRCIADVYECPLACVTQISIYENSAWDVAAVYHSRIQSNNVRPQAGWVEEAPVWTDSKWMYEHKTRVKVLIKMSRKFFFSFNLFAVGNDSGACSRKCCAI